MPNSNECKVTCENMSRDIVVNVPNIKTGEQIQVDLPRWFEKMCVIMARIRRQRERRLNKRDDQGSVYMRR